MRAKKEPVNVHLDVSVSVKDLAGKKLKRGSIEKTTERVLAEVFHAFVKRDDHHKVMWITVNKNTGVVLSI